MKHIPIRTCKGCGRKTAKTDLIRIGYSGGKILSVSLSSKGPGRGAYVCRDLRCIEKTMDPKRIRRIIRAELTQDQIDSLKAQLEGLLGEPRGGID